MSRPYMMLLVVGMMYGGRRPLLVMGTEFISRHLEKVSYTNAVVGD